LLRGQIHGRQGAGTTDALVPLFFQSERQASI